VDEKFPVKAFLTYDNYQSPAIGDQRGQVTIVDQNVTGFCDVLSFSYGASSGVNPLIDASYSFPFTPFDTTITVGYRRNSAIVVEESMQALDITSRTNTFSISIRQPFARRLRREFAVGVTLDRQRNETYLLGEPFSFSPGAVDGKATITALRIFQEWTSRTQARVIMARSRFSIGFERWGPRFMGRLPICWSRLTGGSRIASFCHGLVRHSTHAACGMTFK
jgi:hemolysin activation/secretion protein